MTLKPEVMKNDCFDQLIPFGGFASYRAFGSSLSITDNKQMLCTLLFRSNFCLTAWVLRLILTDDGLLVAYISSCRLYQRDYFYPGAIFFC